MPYKNAAIDFPIAVGRRACERATVRVNSCLFVVGFNPQALCPPLRSGERKGFFGCGYAAPRISNKEFQMIMNRRVLGNAYVEPNLIDLQ